MKRRRIPLTLRITSYKSSFEAINQFIYAFRSGRERVVGDTGTDTFRFAGMEWDSEDALNHTLFRQYTPFQGRWQTPDPQRGCVRNPQNHNRYAYVVNGPMNRVDPRGDQCTISDPSCSFCDLCNEDPSFADANSVDCDRSCGNGGSGGGVTQILAICDCYLDFPNLRFNGCNYECYCTPGGYPWSARESCSILQSKGYWPCPSYVYYVELQLFVPGESDDFCGSWPSPPTNPPKSGPRPPIYPPPPPPPSPQPVPIPI